MISDTKKKVLELFHEGRNKYKLMDFTQAAALFEQALKLDPADGPSQVYYDRCTHYIENPPPEDWDGVYVKQTK